MFLLGLVALAFLLWQKMPYQDSANQILDWPMIVSFNLALFFSFWGLFFSGLFWLKTRLLTRRGRNSQVGKVSRQSFWLALTLLTFSILQQARALFWWDGLLVVAAVMLLEMFFLSFEKDEEKERMI